MTCQILPRLLRVFVCLVAIPTVLPSLVSAQVVPGTGQKIAKVGDDFEDEDWAYVYNLPKSSQNINESTGGRGGVAKNGRWYEGLKRGQPDVVRRVPTPEGGPAGSMGALLLQSAQTGVPGRPSYQLQQDDFIGDVHYRLGGSIPVWQSPNVVVRVFLPPVDQWERRAGPTFAFRVACDTTVRKASGSGVLTRTGSERETYWPGMFIEFTPKEKSRLAYDTAQLRMRCTETGADYNGPQIAQTGWWTLGLSVTGDGRVHYYAKQGLEPLTQADHIASHYPYGFRAERFNTFFFNVCSPDDGHTWSTPWIVDDCEVFYLPKHSTAP